MAVDRHHQGKGCAFAQCSSFGHLRFSACCFPCRCRWGSWWKSQKVLWTFRIFPNKKNGDETCSFYRRYSEIILGSLWWQGLLIGNCFPSFGTENRFNYFSFSTCCYPENRKNKEVSSKREPKREPLSCFRSALICILSTHWKISVKFWLIGNQFALRKEDFAVEQKRKCCLKRQVINRI